MNVVFINHLNIDKDLDSVTQISVVNSLNKLKTNTVIFVPSCVKRNVFKTKNNYIQRIKVYSSNSYISSPVFNLKLLFLIPKIIIKHKPEFIIIDHLSFPGSIIYIILSKFNLIKPKFVFDVRSQPVSLFGLVGNLRNIQYKISIKLSRLIMNNYTFLTKKMAEKQMYENKIDYNKSNVGFWGCGVDYKLFNPAHNLNKSNKLKKRENLENKFVIFYHGTIAPNRGLDRLVMAMKIVNAENKNIVLFILGRGQERDHLQHIIEKEKLVGSVIIHKAVTHSEVPVYVMMADVCIIPLPKHKDWNYQQPLKLFEYLSMNKKIILTSIPAHRDVVDESNKITFIQNIKPNTIAKSINDMFVNSIMKSDTDSVERNLVINNYSWDNVAKTLLIYLGSIIENAKNE